MVYATVIVAVPVFVLSNIDCAVTVIDVTVAFAGTFKIPLFEIVTPSASAVESTAQPTALFAKPVVTTVAVNCNVCPLLTVAVAGLTLTLDTAGVSLVNTAPVFKWGC